MISSHIWRIVRPAAIQKKNKIIETKTCHMKLMLLTLFLINLKAHNYGYIIGFLKSDYIWVHMQFFMFLLICVSQTPSAFYFWVIYLYM